MIDDDELYAFRPLSSIDDDELYAFRPLSSINAYELAQILASMEVKVSKSILDQLPKECRQHFNPKPHKLVALCSYEGDSLDD